jgi:hypothetical protein
MSQEIKNQVAQILEANNIKLVYEFVPFSKSRNKGDVSPSLNYKVRVLKGEREVLETDFMMGCGHCPAYKRAKVTKSYETQRLIKAECEAGVSHKLGYGASIMPTRNKIEPTAADVFYSLVLDAGVLDYSGFEDWALEFGYDKDSRKAEKIYRDCLDTALKLKNGLGDSVLNELREALQDY